ncbi:MAG: hypothetical protein AB7I49_12305 [Candidatus Nitrosocosmicus sp.]|jgi:hypothetical protein
MSKKERGGCFDSNTHGCWNASFVNDFYLQYALISCIVGEIVRQREGRLICLLLRKYV